jgi:hypothetical protein
LITCENNKRQDHNKDSSAHANQHRLQIRAHKAKQDHNGPTATTPLLGMRCGGKQKSLRAYILMLDKKIITHQLDAILQLQYGTAFELRPNT